MAAGYRISDWGQCTKWGLDWGFRKSQFVMLIEIRELLGDVEESPSCVQICQIQFQSISCQMFLNHIFHLCLGKLGAKALLYRVENDKAQIPWWSFMVNAEGASTFLGMVIELLSACWRCIIMYVCMCVNVCVYIHGCMHMEMCVNACVYICV